MGREIVVTCDGCGLNVHGKTYVTMNIRKVTHGKQTKHPTIWLCPECFKKTKLPALLLCDMKDTEDKE
jgi:hypothetical protein